MKLGRNTGNCGLDLRIWWDGLRSARAREAFHQPSCIPRAFIVVARVQGSSDQVCEVQACWSKCRSQHPSKACLKCNMHTNKTGVQQAPLPRLPRHGFIFLGHSPPTQASPVFFPPSLSPRSKVRPFHQLQWESGRAEQIRATGPSPPER